MWNLLKRLRTWWRAYNKRQEEAAREEWVRIIMDPSSLDPWIRSQGFLAIASLIYLLPPGKVPVWLIGLYYGLVTAAFVTRPFPMGIGKKSQKK